VAGAVGRVENLVVKDGKVEGETQTNGVRRRELSLSDVGGVLDEIVSAFAVKQIWAILLTL
jgi:hypothetical protein